MWLLGRLVPDFKTIADFRGDNSAGIQSVCRPFVLLSERLELFSDDTVAVGRSKFKSVWLLQLLTNSRMELRNKTLRRSLLWILSTELAIVSVQKPRLHPVLFALK